MIQLHKDTIHWCVPALLFSSIGGGNERAPRGMGWTTDGLARFGRRGSHGVGLVVVLPLRTMEPRTAQAQAPPLAR
jgi:hypothetical protein